MSDLEIALRPEYQSGMSALRFYRQRAGLTQESLAELAETSQPQIRRLESYQRSLTKEWANVLAGPLGISPDDLIFPSDEALKDTPDLRDVIARAGTTIKIIAKETGIDYRLLHNVAQGRYSLNENAIVRLAKFLDLEVSFVRQAIGGTSDRVRSANRLSRSDNVIDDDAEIKPISTQIALAPAGSSMPVFGEVAAGRWLATDENIDEPKFPSAPLTADPQWPASAQYGLVVRGTSINKFAVDGDILHCVSVEDAGVVPINGEMVIVEQSRDGGLLREITAKIFHKNDDGSIELRAYSDDHRWDHHIHMPSAEFSQMLETGVIINVKAIVVGSYRPAKIGRARLRR